MDVITTLQAHIDTYLSKLDFGYLPPNLCMMGLAAQMNKNAQAWVREVLPRVARRLAFQDGQYPTTPEIQGYHLPRVFRTENPWDCLQYGMAGSHTPDHRFDGRDSHGAQRQTPQEATRGFNRRPTHDGPRGRYARPDHNRQLWYPDVTCAACKRRGHPAANCDMLAMALFLERYNRSMSNADRDKIEAA